MIVLAARVQDYGAQRPMGPARNPIRGHRKDSPQDQVRNASGVSPTSSRPPSCRRRRPATGSPFRKVPLRERPSSVTTQWPPTSVSRGYGGWPLRIFFRLGGVGFAETLAATRDLLPEPIGFEEGAGPARRALDATRATRAARAARVPRSRPAAAGCGRAARHARATGGSSQAVASAAAAASLVCPLEASLSKARSQAAIRRFAGRPSRCGTGALQEGSGVTRRGRRWSFARPVLFVRGAAGLLIAGCGCGFGVRSGSVGRVLIARHTTGRRLPRSQRWLDGEIDLYLHLWDGPDDPAARVLFVIGPSRIVRTSLRVTGCPVRPLMATSCQCLPSFERDRRRHVRHALRPD
jgi:hypothetical protein